MKTLAVLARKGGVGKTTLAVHLAVVAGQAGRRVILVDADPQRSATGWWEARADEAPELVQCNAAQIGDALKAAEAAGVDLAVVDTRPSVEADTVTVARQSDFVLIPSRPSILDLRAIGATVDVVVAVKAHAAIVLNAVPPGRGTAEAALTAEARAALAAYQVAVAPVTIGQRAALAHALVDGQAVTEFEPNGKASAELRHLWNFVRSALWRRRERS